MLRSLTSEIERLEFALRYDSGNRDDNGDGGHEVEETAQLPCAKCCGEIKEIYCAWYFE